MDLSADFAGWASASSGAIAGNLVLGAEFSQDHLPFVSIIADSSNPLRIWTGVYAPDNYEPRLVQMTASPIAHSYYPSELTSSSADCEAAPGSTSLFVNPHRIGRVGIVPGAGTDMEPLPDGGRLTSETGRIEAAAICHGVTVLAWARVDGDSPDDGDRVQPSELTIDATMNDSADRPVESHSLNYTEVEFEYKARGESGSQGRWTMPMYTMTPGSDRHDPSFAYAGFLGGVTVAAGDFNDAPGPLSYTLPTSIRVIATVDVGPMIECRYDAPTPLFLADGRWVVADRIEIRPANPHPDIRKVGSARFVLDGVGDMTLRFEDAMPFRGGVNPIFVDGSVRFVTGS